MHNISTQITPAVASETLFFTFTFSLRALEILSVYGAETGAEEKRHGVPFVGTAGGTCT
jgi:hypothetical protein